MKNSLGRHFAISSAIALAVPLLTGCAINKDLRLDTHGPGLTPRSEVSLQKAPAGNEQIALFAASLADAFASSGYAVKDDAPVTAVFGFALRNRSTGTADGSPAAEGSQAGIKWISAPARKRAFQGCKGERVRATLALYSRTEKTLIYRGTGEMDGCAFTQTDIDGLAKALVGGALR